LGKVCSLHARFRKLQWRAAVVARQADLAAGTICKRDASGTVAASEGVESCEETDALSAIIIALVS